MAINDINQSAMHVLRDDSADFGAMRGRSRGALLASTALACALAVTLLVRPAQANDWIAGTGDWFVPGNWNTNTVPTASDDASINNSGTAHVQGPGAEANDVYVGTGSTLQIGNGFDASINSLAGGGSVIIGSSGPFTLLGIGLNGGATTTFSGAITGAGTLELSGGALTLTGVSSIGGDLMICDCAALTISGPGASFTATGNLIGVLGTEVDGTLNVLNGASFTTTDLAIVGSMTVSGANSTATSHGVTVVGALPSFASASLRIENGGVVNSIGGAFIANPFGITAPSVTVTGTNSMWNVGTFLDVGGATVGFGTPASLTINDRGVVNVTATTTIGADPTLGFGPAAISVTGAGSAFNTQSLVIGTAGCGCGGDFAGVFTVANGAAATASVDTQIGALGTLNLGTGGLAGTFVTPTIVNNGQIVANFTDMLTLAAAISGTGSLTKSGTGTLILTGNNTYFGATTVSAGRLVVNGSLVNSAVDVQGGGTLGGSGTLGELTVGSGGIVAPGNSIGTLNVGGNWTLGSGATYEVELKSGGNTPGTHNDVINVGGTATIAAGSNILVKPDNGTYAAGTKYTIVQATTLTVAALPSISDSLAFLDFTGSYDANNFYLTASLAVSSFCLPGQTANQCATGNGAFSLGPGNSVFDQLLNMSAAQVAAALNQLSGEAHASAQSLFIQNTGFVRDAALARVRSAFEQDGGNTAIMSYAPAKFAPAPAPARRALWTDIFGVGSRNNGDGNAAAIDGREYGFLAGADGFVAGDWTLGALAGYTRSHFNVNDRLSSGDSDNLHLGAYGGTMWGQIGFRAGLANTWHFIDTQRTALAQTLNGDYTARTFQTFGELGYRFDRRTAWLEPFANAAYVAHHTDSFAETGGAAALNIRNGDSDTGFTTLGLRSATQFIIGTTAATARGTVGWRHAFGDIVPVSTNSFVGGAAFAIAGAPIARDAAVFEAGLDFRLSDIVLLGFGYAGQFANTANSQSGRMKLSVSF